MKITTNHTKATTWIIVLFTSKPPKKREIETTQNIYIYMRRRQNILHLSSMILKGYRFFGGPYRFTGFGAFDTILNFHHVEASKFLAA